MSDKKKYWAASKLVDQAMSAPADPEMVQTFLDTMRASGEVDPVFERECVDYLKGCDHESIR